ncbi:MAG: AMP-binding protein, partial [Mycolicibacterium sp.]|nr:AMP-binding protein [Mycolicibacterium sp.]
MTHSDTAPVHATTAECPSGPPPARGQPRRTVAHVLRKACRDHAGRLAVVEGKRRLTYAELERQATSIATWLHSQGLTTGTRVGIVSRNCLEFVIADLAIQLGAFTRVGVSPRLSAD